MNSDPSLPSFPQIQLQDGLCLIDGVLYENIRFIILGCYTLYRFIDQEYRLSLRSIDRMLFKRMNAC